jgi:hypothetical protein
MLGRPLVTASDADDEHRSGPHLVVGTARKAIPSVLGAPGAAEIKLANESNALLSGAIVTSVGFLVEGDPVRVA